MDRCPCLVQSYAHPVGQIGAETDVTKRPGCQPRRGGFALKYREQYREQFPCPCNYKNQCRGGLWILYCSPNAEFMCESAREANVDIFL